jgi:hypothetical protein
MRGAKMSELVNLKALRESVSYCLDNFSEGAARYFDPKNVGNLFDRFDTLSALLQEKYKSDFVDLPDIDSTPSKTTDYEGRGYFTRQQMQVLLMNIDYCIDLLSQSVTVEIPSMKVTREGLFFSGQYFDALQRVGEILSNAQKNITIIDCYIDNKVLDIVSSKIWRTCYSQIIGVP